MMGQDLIKSPAPTFHRRSFAEIKIPLLIGLQIECELMEVAADEDITIECLKVIDLAVLIASQSITWV